MALFQTEKSFHRLEKQPTSPLACKAYGCEAADDIMVQQIGSKSTVCSFTKHKPSAVDWYFLKKGISIIFLTRRTARTPSWVQLSILVTLTAMTVRRSCTCPGLAASQPGPCKVTECSFPRFLRTPLRSGSARLLHDGHCCRDLRQQTVPHQMAKTYQLKPHSRLTSQCTYQEYFATNPGNPVRTCVHSCTLQFGC